MTDSSNSKKPEQFSSEIISPMFGHDYQNRVVTPKESVQTEIEASSETSYLEKQIEEKVEAQTKSEKVKEYQEGCKTDTDVLKQYHKQKEDEELKASLPSHYLNFRDTLENPTDVSTISEFDFTLEDSNTSAHTVSEILDEIFEEPN